MKSAARLNCMLVDCGANFGYWSVLASSQPFGRQAALAIETSPKNAERLEVNARLTGIKHEVLAIYALVHAETAQIGGG